MGPRPYQEKKTAQSVRLSCQFSDCTIQSKHKRQLMKTHQFATRIDLVRLWTFIMNLTKFKTTYNIARKWVGSRSHLCTVWGVCPRQLACWDWGFEYRWGHNYLSLLSVVWCQVEVSASGWSLVPSSSAERGVSEYHREASTMRSWPTSGSCAIKKLSQDCSLGTLTKLKAGRPKNSGLGQGDSSLPWSVRIGFGTHQASYSMGNGAWSWPLTYNKYWG
jgi:hypothetical protein